MLKISDYLDVKKRAQEIGCNVPETLALIPRNFESARSKEDLVHESSALTVRKLWQQNNIIETPIEKPGEKLPLVAEAAFEWIGPTIFVSAMLLSQNPNLVAIALNVISNYLTDWFRGVVKETRKVKLNVIVETKDGDYKKLEYEGPPEGLKNLSGVIKAVCKKNE